MQRSNLGGSGEAALIAATEPIGAMLSKMYDPASQVVKKIYNQHNMYLNNAYAWSLPFFVFENLFSAFSLFEYSKFESDNLSIFLL